MKRWQRPLSLVFVLICFLLLTWIRSNDFAERYGPMRYVESHCQLCDRHRTEKWLSTRKVIDQVVETDCSRWADNYIRPKHEHLWLQSTDTERVRWFGSMYIGCGGVRSVYEVFANRAKFDEAEIREMFTELRQIVGDSPPDSIREIRQFGERVVERAKAEGSSH